MMNCIVTMDKTCLAINMLYNIILKNLYEEILIHIVYHNISFVEN